MPLMTAARTFFGSVLCRYACSTFLCKCLSFSRSRMASARLFPSFSCGKFEQQIIRHHLITSYTPHLTHYALPLSHSTTIHTTPPFTLPTLTQHHLYLSTFHPLHPSHLNSAPFTPLHPSHLNSAPIYTPSPLTPSTLPTLLSTNLHPSTFHHFHPSTPHIFTLILSHLQPLTSLTPSHTPTFTPSHLQLCVTQMFLQNFQKKVPHSKRRTKECNLPLAEQENLVKCMEDLAPWLVYSDDNGTSSSCQHLQAFQDL